MRTGPYKLEIFHAPHQTPAHITHNVGKNIHHTRYSSRSGCTRLPNLRWRRCERNLVCVRCDGAVVPGGGWLAACGGSKLSVSCLGGSASGCVCPQIGTKSQINLRTVLRTRIRGCVSMCVMSNVCGGTDKVHIQHGPAARAGRARGDATPQCAMTHKTHKMNRNDMNQA